ncbi:hypothetical protein DLNHIDIE_00231 [Acidithiobacillus thiooxidans ATCC 19377]|jgi:hypothetical protein|uniref:Uncharacterized protein n=1 Tax=Acidithiobacillus thiooxidans ATCC 19377 TaxID=637390 RepID=A0A543Q253_ACITH|nr:hypothetical protein DLNHIDIE_00231 [Acidithiobacillus thiooxidans ATCC 19377]
MENFINHMKNRKDIRCVSNALHTRLKFPYPERINEVHIDEEGKTIPGIILWNIVSLVQDFPNLFIIGGFLLIFGTIASFL